MTVQGPVLGLDTATARTSVALLAGDEILAEAGFHRRVSPSRALMPAVELLLRTSALSLADLAALAVTVGPGGFTGIRIGLATARALADAAGRPLAGVSTLAALAASADAGPGDPVAAWLDAGRREIYVGLFVNGAPHGPERVVAAEQALTGLPAGPVHFIGDGAVRYAATIAARPGADPGDRVRPLPMSLAASVARLGRDALAAGTALPAAPRYLRPPDATRARG